MSRAWVVVLALGAAGCGDDLSEPGADGGHAGHPTGDAGSSSGAGASGTPSTPAPIACHDASDCPAGTDCFPADFPEPACRGMACPLQCASDADCVAPEVCHTHVDELCSGAFYRKCGMPCSSALDCDDVACQPDGRCLPEDHCTLATACPVHFRCAAEQLSDAFGCVRDSCTADAECGDGRCFHASCYRSLDVCAAPSPPCLAS
jgi:hypothetical protein